MLADVVQSNFPEGVKLPDCLQTVCDYVDIHGYPLSGSFEICDWGRKDAEGWFPNDAATRSQVTIFGRGSTGSSYALWLVPNRNPDEAPVVVFGSEGDSIVLATNALEFCRLLGLGYNELEWDDLAARPSEWTESQGLRNWLAERLRIDFPATGEAIARNARERHPGFINWMTAWQAANL